jgi:tRNA pseudouridine32 synthase/23S rRNA pseudouridine746 synthase
VEVVHEDDHIIVVNKPAGVLSVPSEDGLPSLAQAVFDKCKSSSGNGVGLAKFDQMVVHRLGMDTTGLVVFAKSMDAVRGLNTLFRTRKITRQYEVLVAGHVNKEQGLINLPLMRDYEHPPFMRVSTSEHQAALSDLDPAVVGKKLLEAEKASVTHYQVMSREVFNEKEDLPVTRLTLTSITGRTHQLNVHCAAFGHPIVGDAVYGWGGDAAPNGGLDADTLKENAPDRASDDLQQSLAAATKGLDMCVHAKYIRFPHPATGEEVEFTSRSPF